jgi:cytochrome c-type biogenesis protein CcmH/NrfG
MILKVGSSLQWYTTKLVIYKRLIILNPRNDHYFVRLGELFYSQGGLQNLRNAKDYFCYVVTRDDTNYRALWCLNRVCKCLVE